MSTVSKDIADRIIAGEFPEDGCLQIIEYDNAWGGVAYGCCFGLKNLHKYEESEFVRNPRVYWQAEGLTAAQGEGQEPDFTMVDLIDFFSQQKGITVIVLDDLPNDQGE